MKNLYITYRDNVGEVVQEINADGVSFSDGFAYFTDIYGNDHKHPARDIISIKQDDEREPLRVCKHCLAAIESREGAQATRAIYLDEDDDTSCGWCEESGFDTLYELL
jgi:hypothetical protein